MIMSQLPDGWRELADEMMLIRPQPAQLRTKVTDIEQALRLVLRYVSGSSLRLTTGIGAAIGVIAVSSVALHKWMKKLGPYLAAVLSRMADSVAFAPEQWVGFDVIAGDATTVQRPGSKGTTARVHYALRLADLTTRHIEVTDDKGGETARRFLAEPGELWLLDRGYSNSHPRQLDVIRRILSSCSHRIEVIACEPRCRPRLPDSKLDRSRSGHEPRPPLLLQRSPA
jgi:hypothetical protein